MHHDPQRHPDPHTFNVSYSHLKLDPSLTPKNSRTGLSTTRRCHRSLQIWPIRWNETTGCLVLGKNSQMLSHKIFADTFPSAAGAFARACGSLSGRCSSPSHACSGPSKWTRFPASQLILRSMTVFLVAHLSPSASKLHLATTKWRRFSGFNESKIHSI